MQPLICSLIYTVLLCIILIENKNAMFCCKLISFDYILNYFDQIVTVLLIHFIRHNFSWYICTES